MMSRKLILGIIIGLILSHAHEVRARIGRIGGSDSLCLTLNWNGFSSNPDSIYVDTCLTTHAHPVFWDKGPYFIQFNTDAIKLGYGAPDSDLEVSWEAIDTAFPQLRATFEALANNIGSYTLKKNWARRYLRFEFGITRVLS